MRKSGFTLIELIIVITIIGILAAIAVPYFASAKKRAALESCKMNLKSISDALVLYLNDYSLGDLNNISLNPQNDFLSNDGYLSGNLKCPVSKAYYILTYTQSSGAYTILCPFPTQHYRFPIRKCSKVAYNSISGFEIH